MRYLHGFLAAALGAVVAFTLLPAGEANKPKPLELSKPATASFPISYQLDQAGPVSLLVCNAEGVVVRELLHAAARPAGRDTVAWDGLDEQGQAVPAGTYTWKLLTSQGLKAEYLLTVGTDGNPSWQWWPGNHGPVNAVAVDADGVYAATGCGEGGPLVVKQGADGKRLWEIPHWIDAWVGPTSMASDNGTLWALPLNQKLYRIEAKSGKHLGTWDVGFDDDRKASEFNDCSNITDLDAGGGQVVLSYARQNLVRWLDPADGKELDRATVEEPYGVAVDRSDGSLLVIARDQVVRLSRTAKQPQLVIPRERLNGAHRLSVDPTNGDILVAENAALHSWIGYHYFGKKLVRLESRQSSYYKKRFFPADDPSGGRQVKRFARDGRALAAYGAPQGRVDGAYQKQDFDGLIDIAATPEGGFVTAEEGTVRRTGQFDKNGKWQREWRGGWSYAQFGTPDPTDRSIVWLPHHTSFLKTRVDYQRKTWELLEAYHAPVIHEWFGQSAPIWRLLRRNGVLYFCGIGREGVSGPLVLRFDEAKKRMVGQVASDFSLGHDREIDVGRCLHPLLNDVTKGKQGSWVWSDRNGDGMPTAEEMLLSPYEAHAGGWSIGDDFTYYFHDQTDKLDKITIYAMPVQEWTASGTPVYDFSKLKEFAPDPGWSDSTWCDEAGNVYAGFNNEGLHGRRYGIGFWSPRASVNRVVKWDKTGKRQWIVGRHAAGSQAEPGEGKYFWRFIGSTHGCILMNDVEEGMTHVWDQDGLWVGRLFDQPVVTSEIPLSAYEQCGENFGGALHTDAKTGEVLYYGGSVNCVRVYRITGFDQLKRQSGKVEVSAQLATRIGERLRSEAMRSDVIRARGVERNQMKIDGDLNEWKDAKPVSIKDGTKELAKVYLAWNSEGLYAAFDVTTTTPWRSSASAELAFQGGASVDVKFGAWEPPRSAPIPGDMRITVAPLGGKAVGVEFLPHLTRDMSPPHNTREATYKTLNGAITFKRVTPIGDELSASKVKPDGSGYTVEVFVQRREPHAFRPGLRLRFDATVVLSDPLGTKSILRLPWHSREAGDMATQDVYFESLLRPQAWGEAVLE